MRLSKGLTETCRLLKAAGWPLQPFDISRIVCNHNRQDEYLQISKVLSIYIFTKKYNKNTTIRLNF